MNKAANTYWVDTRLAAQQPMGRSLSLSDAASAWVGTRTEVRRRGGLIPSWAVFLTIMLATFALCASVTVRTHAEMSAAGDKHQQLLSEVETLRHTNASLKRDVHRLRTDPRAIEAAAREQLNMVRADEIIVPIE
ncbi:MAG: septum formation initiator family protein [Acidobacteriota bacterium]|nr:septum formation initiator family protein [Acidobacteriota bacterium]